MKLSFLSLLMVGSFATSAAMAANPEWDSATRLFNLGDYRSALSAFRKIAEKTPNEPTVHYMLGQCYKNTGNTRQAILELEWVSRATTNKNLKGPSDALLAQLRSAGAGTSAGTKSGAGSGSGKPDSAGSAGSAPSSAASAGGGDAPPGKDFIGDSSSQTISAAAKKGWVPCRGADCLNFGTNGWHHADMPGHPATDMWMDFTLDDGTHYSWTQKHIGDLIKQAKDIGPCPQCNGTGWIRGK